MQKDPLDRLYRIDGRFNFAEWGGKDVIRDQIQKDVIKDQIQKEVVVRGATG